MRQITVPEPVVTLTSDGNCVRPSAGTRRAAVVLSVFLAAYDNAQARVGTKSAWITGPSTADVVSATTSSNYVWEEAC